MVFLYAVVVVFRNNTGSVVRHLRAGIVKIAPHSYFWSIVPENDGYITYSLLRRGFLPYTLIWCIRTFDLGSAVIWAEAVGEDATEVEHFGSGRY